MNIEKIKVKELINNEFAVSPSDGDKIFEVIKKDFENDISVSLDFEEISLVTSAFLNNAIGKLFINFSYDSMSKLLKLSNIKESELKLFKLVISTAIEKRKENEKKDKSKSEMKN